MTKAKKTKRSLVLSILSMLTCVAMLIGSTFAWFYDEASVDGNSIVAGHLKIGLRHKNKDNGEWEDAEGRTDLFQLNDNWEPGKVVYEEFEVENLKDLAAKFAVYADEQHMSMDYVVEPNTGVDAET